MVYKSGQIFSTVLSQSTRVTDRQTEFSLLDRVCISCSAVKINTTLSNIKRNRPKLVGMCGYKLATNPQNFTEIYLT